MLTNIYTRSFSLYRLNITRQKVMSKESTVLEVFAAVLLQLFAVVSSSAGDGSWFFQKCARNCWRVNCSHVLGTQFNCCKRLFTLFFQILVVDNYLCGYFFEESEFLSRQPVHLRLLRWTCEDECDYTCMWQTVDAFQRDKSKIPQFHGKVCNFIITLVFRSNTGQQLQQSDISR